MSEWLVVMVAISAFVITVALKDIAKAIRENTEVLRRK